MKAKFTWGHGVVAALACFIGFILFLIFIYSRGYQNAEMVSDNYYEEEINFQKVIDAKNAAQKLKEKPVYTQDKRGITIQFPKEFNNQNSKFKFYLYRTDDANLDIRKEVSLDQDNSIFIPASAGIFKPGSYTLKLNWERGDKEKYQIDYNLIWN
ncbi:FixH family protein [Elizabethkingia sp. JS20170427COW]|uniref:FixH family protein n=1 Tax=Elizabethkingia sp. JS20170427COW TaxID=2583851 RepID=UPI001110C8D4|nr:FixH family protein [Elizabethkingia sp. JS20170427COW]QCX53232.1 nitrogen fixation protein FixH [Elizabethkingia sp. JS20170427COW]